MLEFFCGAVSAGRLSYFIGRNFVQGQPKTISKGRLWKLAKRKRPNEKVGEIRRLMNKPKPPSPFFWTALWAVSFDAVVMFRLILPLLYIGGWSGRHTIGCVTFAESCDKIRRTAGCRNPYQAYEMYSIASEYAVHLNYDLYVNAPSALHAVQHLIQHERLISRFYTKIHDVAHDSLSACWNSFMIHHSTITLLYCRYTPV